MSEKKSINLEVVSKDIFDIQVIDRDTGMPIEGITRIVWEAVPDKQKLTLEFLPGSVPVRFEGKFVGEIVKEDEENESVHEG